MTVDGSGRARSAITSSAPRCSTWSSSSSTSSIDVRPQPLDRGRRERAADEPPQARVVGRILHQHEAARHRGLVDAGQLAVGRAHADLELLEHAHHVGVAHDAVVAERRLVHRDLLAQLVEQLVDVVAPVAAALERVESEPADRGRGRSIRCARHEASIAALSSEALFRRRRRRSGRPLPGSSRPSPPWPRRRGTCCASRCGR